MKYTKGCPNQVYIVTSQMSGDSEVFTSLRQARAIRKFHRETLRDTKATLATYTLKEIK